MTSNVTQKIRYAWQHKHMLYSYLLLRLAMISPFGGVNAFLHGLRGVTVGRKVKIYHDVIIDPVEPGSVILEDYVTLSPGVIILTHTNPLSPSAPIYQYVGPREVNPVRIKEASWIGANAIILPGVTVGKYCVVGAGAVVTKDIPDFTVAVGVPAKPIRILKRK